MRRSLYLFSIILIAFRHVFAQGCCTVGASSLGGLESGVRQEHSLSIALGYQSNTLTQTYQGTAKIADPLRRTADVRYVTLELEYGLTNVLSVLGSINYSDKTREITITTGSGSTRIDTTASFRGNGIGDLILLVKYAIVHPTISEPTGFAIGIGASLLTGSFTQEQNNAQLSIDLQPGTGAATLLGWFLASHGFSEIGLRLFLTSTYRYAGTNFDGYRLGDEILTTLLVEKSITGNYSGFVALRSRFAEKDFANRRFLIGTGGTYHDFMPGVGYADGPSSLKLFGQFPVYRNVRGIQLTLAHMIGLQFTYRVG
jgi:hypothetical protein